MELVILNWLVQKNIQRLSGLKVLRDPVGSCDIKASQSNYIQTTRASSSKRIARFYQDLVEVERLSLSRISIRSQASMFKSIQIREYIF